MQGHGVRHLHGARFYALKVAEECGDISTAAHVRVMLAHTHFWRGEFRDGMAAAELAFQALVGSKDGLWIGMSLWILANNTLLLGDLTSTVNAGQRLRTVGESTADRRLQCYAQVILGVATAYRDRSRGAVATAEQALTLAPDPLARSVAELLVGEACLEAEAFEEARGHLRAALETFESAKMPHAWNWAASCLADAELAAKNHQAARELAESVVERTHEAFFPQGRGRALRTLARVNQDDQQLEEALRSFDAIGAAFEAARTRMEIAKLVRTPELLAREHVTLALHSFEAGGASTYARQAEELMTTVLARSRAAD